MGLDMFGYALNSKEELKEVSMENWYWRKHPNLHGFIINEIMKVEDCGNETAETTVIYDGYELSRDLIEEIIIHSRENDLPKTEGFFFGVSTEEQNKYTIEVCLEMLKKIEEGQKIFYVASW